MLGSLLATVVVAGAASVPASAAATAPRIDLKVLLLGISTAEPNFQSWQAALQREGVRFDTIVGPSHTPITSSTLSRTLPDGTLEAKYDAIIVSVGDLMDCSTMPCVSDLTASEAAALEHYEHQFSIRQISGDIFPGSAYGMNTPPTGGGAALDGTQGTLSADGQKVFPYLKVTAAVTMDTGTWGYESTPITTSNFDTLVGGPSGSSLVGIYTHADGVQELVETFAQNQNQLQSELLRHGAIAWATRGVYFGDQRNYLETNIDDNFLADDSWDTTTHTTDYDPAAAIRERASDVDGAASWSAQNNFRIDMLFNGGGSVQFAAGCTVATGGGSGGTSTGCSVSAPGTDPLLAEFQNANPATTKPYAASFGWINHTWDHPNLDQGCATQNYIEAEIQQNTIWASSAPGATAGTGGLGLSPTTDPSVALGAENPGVLVTGEHSGLANLIPGNPGTVDPPSFNTATPSATGGSAGGAFTAPQPTVTYAITDQFSSTGGESSGSTTVLSVPAGGSVTLTWGAACHAADYKIYRQIGTTGTWALLTTMPAPSNSFVDPAGGSTINTAGGGATTLTYTDTGVAGTNASAPSTTTNHAAESAYQQNTSFASALTAVGIKAFGSDSSKPYPNPVTATFTAGSPPSTQYAAGATFTDGGAQAEARYPTNIYYNVSTEAQEVDEYNHLYLPPSLGGACQSSSTTTCLTAPVTFADIINSVDQNMFQHVMGNDPRPHYFHQTNLMGQPPAGAPTTGTPPNTAPAVGDGLFYSTMSELLAQYNTYFNVPLQQPTSLAIATLLADQAAWASNTSVSGYIQGNQVTLTNSGTSAVKLPLTGITTVGSSYGGTQSGCRCSRGVGA